MVFLVEIKTVSRKGAKPGRCLLILRSLRTSASCAFKLRFNAENAEVRRERKERKEIQID
jgi:hypothetical protein